MFVSKNRCSYQLHIQLQDIKPAIWRRVVVADTTSLAQLHRIIQAAMGGVMGQRFAFEVAGQRYGAPNPDMPEDPTMDARRYTLAQLMQGQPLPMRYSAGMAGGLHHRIKLEACTPADPAQLEQLPECLAGRIRCPPYASSLTGNCFDLAAAQQRVQSLSAAANPVAPTSFSAAMAPSTKALPKAAAAPSRGTEAAMA